MRLGLSALILLHGLIHLLGFVHAFGLAKVPALSQAISRPLGLLWLLAALLWVATAILLGAATDFWWLIAALALLTSQAVICTSWRDARVGGLVNLILLVPVLVGGASAQFRRDNQRLLGQLRALPLVDSQRLQEAELAKLPPVVQTWLRRSGQVGQVRPQAISLKQRGTMRTSPSGAWMSFAAEQYIRVAQPAFVWTTRVELFPGVFLLGRDQLLEGHGQMLIKALGLVPVVHAQGPEIDQGALLRYLGESAWIPSVAVESWLSWESLDAHRVQATLRSQNQSVRGVFEFTPEGDFQAFEAMRYYGAASPPTLERWRVEAEPGSLRPLGHGALPARYRVLWKLKSGDFEWLRLELTELQTHS